MPAELAASKPAAPARRTPIRTCVACRTSGGKRGLIRVVRLPEAERDAAPGSVSVAIDPTGKRSGRGAYLCRAPECVALALKKKALERSLKTALPASVADELKQLTTASPPALPGSPGNANDDAVSNTAAAPMA